jgi:hypothetical protein
MRTTSVQNSQTQNPQQHPKAPKAHVSARQSLSPPFHALQLPVRQDLDFDLDR